MPLNYLIDKRHLDDNNYLATCKSGGHIHTSSCCMCKFSQVTRNRNVVTSLENMFYTFITNVIMAIPYLEVIRTRNQTTIWSGLIEDGGRGRMPYKNCTL